MLGDAWAQAANKAVEVMMSQEWVPFEPEDWPLIVWATPEPPAADPYTQVELDRMADDGCPHVEETPIDICGPFPYPIDWI